ncbi:STAS domain-containing protein [Parasulfitobacter algicola]|nr:STAS domain-containing protein [Sulfitobacter algicola]
MAETILLPSRLDVKAAPGLHKTLSPMDGDVVLDASGVTHIGTQCLQVILACKQKLDAANTTLRLENLSTDCTEQLALFGLDSNFSTETAT